MRVWDPPAALEHDWHAYLDACAAHLAGRDTDWDDDSAALLPRYRALAG